MKKFWVCAFLAASVAFAQEEKKPGGDAAPAPEKAFPFEGEVSAARLNVRIFPKADSPGVVATVLSEGDKVTVVGEREGYYHILPAKGCTAWVSEKSVRRDGAAGTVTAGEATVRTDSRVNADALCTLKEGDAVRIVSEHMGWYLIEAPAAVSYFVGKRYVRSLRALDESVLPAGFTPAEPKPSKPAADAEARAKLREADALRDVQMKLINDRRLDEIDFTGVVDAYGAAAALAGSGDLKSEAERGYKLSRDLQAAWATHRERKIEEDLRLADLKKVLETPKVEEKPYAMTGYVDLTGQLWMRPGTHKLVMGGRIVGFLRAKDGDDKMPRRLNDLYQQYVGVNGLVIKNPEGWDGYTVVVVDEVIPITKKD